MTDPEELRMAVLRFDPRRGPYELRLHPLHRMILWLENEKNVPEDKARNYAMRLRQILVAHSLTAVLQAADPDDVIDPGIVYGQHQHTKQSDRGQLRRTVRYAQEWWKEAEA